MCVVAFHFVNVKQVQKRKKPLHDFCEHLDKKEFAYNLKLGE